MSAKHVSTIAVVVTLVSMGSLLATVVVVFLLTRTPS